VRRLLAQIARGRDEATAEELNSRRELGSMFNKPTVFIVGAGASSECALPTGAQLKAKIADGLDFYFEAGQLSRGDNALLAILRDHSQKVDVPACRSLAAAIPTFESIDEALHWWGNHQEMVNLGKIAIAHYLMEAERDSPLSKRKDGFFDLTEANDTW
jgi:hypothetical protein